MAGVPDSGSRFGLVLAPGAESVRIGRVHYGREEHHGMQFPGTSQRGLVRVFRSVAAVVRLEGAVLVAALGFGTVSVFATRWFVVFVVLAIAFLLLAWVRALGDSETSVRFRRRARWIGFWVWAGLLALTGLAIFWRFAAWWSAAVFAVAYLAIGGWHLYWLGHRGKRLSRNFRQAVALTVLPILAAWIINSTLYQAYAAYISGQRLEHLDAAGLSGRREMRSRSAEGDRVQVAVALSGGGYRASALHAGVLFALEEAGVSIDYLSTVSGGSIVGAAFASVLVLLAVFAALGQERVPPALVADLFAAFERAETFVLVDCYNVSMQGWPEAGISTQREMLLRSPGGDQLTLMAWTSPLKTAAGKLLEVLAIFTDLPAADGEDSR